MAGKRRHLIIDSLYKELPHTREGEGGKVMPSNSKAVLLANHTVLAFSES